MAWSLLSVIDAFDQNFRSQLAVVREVLSEIGAEGTPYLLLLNKSDCLNEDQKLSLKQEFSDSILLSTRSPGDIQALRERIIAFFEKDMIEEEILVPYNAQGIIGEVRSNMKILNEKFTEEGIRLLVLPGRLTFGV